MRSTEAAEAAALGRDGDEVARYAGGDTARERSLRACLEVIHEHNPDREVRDLVGRVLDGSSTVRELTREPRFVSAMSSAMDELSARMTDLDEEGRAELLAQGRRIDEEG